jgi:hypothetical protein
MAEFGGCCSQDFMGRRALLFRTVTTNSNLFYQSVTGAADLKGTRPVKLMPVLCHPVVDREASS